MVDTPLDVAATSSSRVGRDSSILIVGLDTEASDAHRTGHILASRRGPLSLETLKKFDVPILARADMGVRRKMKVGDLVPAGESEDTHTAPLGHLYGRANRSNCALYSLPACVVIVIDTQDEALAQEMQPGTVGKSLADQFESHYLLGLLFDILAETSRRAA